MLDFVRMPILINKINSFNKYLYNQCILDILNDKMSGVIFRNVFNQFEVNELIELMSDISSKSENTLPKDQGFVYPPTIYSFQSLLNRNKVDNERVKKQYFQEVKSFVNDLEHRLSFNFFEKLNEYLSLGKESSESIFLNIKQNPYAPITFRYLAPNKGEMTIHCELFLRDFAKDFYETARPFLSLDSQLSFFILLNKPKNGGRFFIYDLKHKDVAVKRTNNIFILKNGLEINIEEDVKKEVVELNVGDMLIFNGGDLWHRTELVQGSEPRITLGGFLALNKEKNKVIYWS